MKTPRPRRVRRPITSDGPRKIVATFSIPLDNWPPPGELEEALKAASDAFAHILRIALEEKLQGTIVADLFYAPPNPDLN